MWIILKNSIKKYTSNLSHEYLQSGPQNLQVDAHERSIRVYWDEAVVPAETESLNYRARLQNDNIRPIDGEVLPTPDAKYNYACYFRDLWTDTQYTLVITTVIDEGDWNPPYELPIKTRRGRDNLMWMSLKLTNAIVSLHDLEMY